MRGQKIHQPTFVDRNQADFLWRPGLGILALEGRQKIQQHLVVVFVAFVLAAVVVNQVTLPRQVELAAIGQTAMRCTAACLHLFFQALQERCLAITCVARDQHQAKLALQNRWQQLAIQLGLHVGGMAQGIHATCAGIAAAALAVEREQMRYEGIAVWR